MATAIELKGLCKRFGDTWAVKPLDLRIERGEFCVLLGPSGCGKSTLLRLISGLEEPTGGRLEIDGRDATDRGAGERNVAMVFQNYALYPHMTVYENLAFPLRTRKTGREEEERRVMETARLLKIDSLLRRKPAALSGGQRQRVAIGRAWVRRPSVFLFDEPLSNLDAALRMEMRVELARLHRDLSATMLYVTHDQVEAMTLASRIVLLRNGELDQVGSPQELYQAPKTLFAATFLGSPPMNILPAGWSGRDSVSSCEVQGFEKPMAFKGEAAGRAEARVGIRPEDLVIVRSGESGAGGLGVFAGEVDVVEDLGKERYVYVRSGAQMVTVRAGPEVGPLRAGDPCRVCARRAHLFVGDQRVGELGA